jgi:hypothetical protein
VQGIGLWYTCWSLIGGLTLEVRDRVCLDGSSGGPVSESLFIKEDKERQESPHGAFYLGPGPFYGLTSNFLCPYNLLLG